MRATVDSAGRVLLPLALRQAVGLVPGDVEVWVDGTSLRISSIATDQLVEDAGLLLLPEGPATTDDDVRQLRFPDES